MREKIERVLATIVGMGISFGAAKVLQQWIVKDVLIYYALLIGGGCAAIVILAMVCGFLLRKKMHRQSERPVDLVQEERERQEYKNRLHLEYETERRQFYRQMKWGMCYFAMLYMMVLVMMTCVCIMGMCQMMAFGILIVLLPLLYALNGPLCLWLPSPSEETKLSEEDYPELYRIVRETFAYCNVKGLIQLYMFPDLTLAVTRWCGRNKIIIGAKLVALIDEQELRQGLIHEAVHIRNKDVRINRILDTAYEQWNYFSSSIWGRIAESPLYLLPYLYNKKYLLFKELSSYEEESRADKGTALLCDRQEEINGMAKVYVYDDCYLEECAQNDESWYLKNEELAKEIYNTEIRKFKEMLVEKEQVWLQEIENALTENIATHPGFAERKAIMGAPKCEIRFVENSKPYEEERRKLIKAAEQEIYNNTVAKFAKLREESYLKPMKEIKAYETGEIEKTLLTKLKIAGLYEDVFLYDKAFCLYEEILKEDLKNATALYKIGSIKLMRKDPSGIADVYASLENNYNDCEEKIEMIGDYCVKLGLAKEYAYWLQWKNETLNYYYNQFDKLSDCWKEDCLFPSDLEEALIERRKEQILTLGQGGIDKIYLVRKQLEDDCKMNSFLLKPKSEVEDKKWDAIFEQVFLLLDNDAGEDIQYGLNCLREEPELERIVSKVEGSCIYRDK